MPKKKIEPEKNKFKKLSWQKEIPVINGVQSSLGWMPPYMDGGTDNMFMPREGYTAKTGELFHDLLKNRFGLDLEADPQDADMRIFSPNGTGREFKAKYLQEMEEADLMPECKEKYQKKEKIAKEFEKGLFYLMAKGSLAVVPLGETEPRQIRCDVNNEVFTVTEPLVLCSSDKIQSMYQAYYQQKATEPKPPIKPVFTLQEPDKPVEPEPFTMKEPGKRPEPPRFKKRPDPPVKPKDILEGTTREKMIDALYQQKVKEANLVNPGEKLPPRPVFNMRKPQMMSYTYGSMQPPDPNRKPPEPPVKPEGYEEFMNELEARELQVQKSHPGEFDRAHYVPFSAIVPEPFTEQPPDPPYLDIPEPPELKLIEIESDPPKPQWRFDPPKPLELLKLDKKEPQFTMQELKEPVMGKLPETLVEPVLRNRPANPNFFKRFFRNWNSNWDRQAEDYDNWVQENREFPSKLEQYKAKVAAEFIHLKDVYDKEKTEYAQKMQEYKTAKTEYETKLKEYNTEKELVDHENDLRRTKYESELSEYNYAKEQLGDRFGEEKAKYEKSVLDWQLKNKEAIETNEKLKAEYEIASERFQKLDEIALKTYGDAYGDPEKMAAKRAELEHKYKVDLEDYNLRKKNSEEAIEAHYKRMKLASEEAQKLGTKPEDNIRYNMQYNAKLDIHNKQMLDLAEFRKTGRQHLEYQAMMEEYDDHLTMFNLEEERWEEYQEEATEYEKQMAVYNKAEEEYKKKKEFYDNWYEIRDKYENDLARLKKSAQINVDHQIAVNKEEWRKYEEAREKWEYDCDIYDIDKERYDEGVRQMHEPGGLIDKWEKYNEQYNLAKKEHAEKVADYNKKKEDYPFKLQAYNKKLEEHVDELQEYNQKKLAYDVQLEKYKRTIASNNQIREEHLNKLNDDPVRQDYFYNKERYMAGYNRWSDYMDNNLNYQKIQYKDPEKYKKEQQQYYKNFAKRKSSAPKEMSNDDKQSYKERVQEHEYLKKYPQGMHSYLRELNAQEKEYNNSINSKYQTEEDLNGISLNTYKEMAVNKIYYYKVRDEAQRYAGKEFYSDFNTKKIDNMLNNKHKNNAIDSMYKNKSLMNELEKEYKIAKEVGTVASSLNDKVGLRVMYEEAFTPKKGSITDPITGKENEAPQFGPVRK